MDLLEQYVCCYKLSQNKINEPCCVTLNEFADVLCCSRRNAKLVLQKMEAHGWIAWHPGRGRGHKSEIVFYKNPEDLISRQMKKWMEQGRMNRMIRLLNDTAFNGQTAEQLRHFLAGQFGLHTEWHHTRPLDVVRIPFPRKLSTLDPLYASLTTEVHLSRQIFDTLIRYNLKTHGFEPHLAHSWESGPDQKEWLFYLRKGVYFHHGLELTAADVIFSMKRIQAASSPCSWYFAALTGLETVGRYAVRMTFSEPMGFLLHLLSSIHAAIISADSGFREDDPCGTGLFRVTQKSDEALVLTRFDRYFGEQALLDEIAIYFIRVRTAETALYQADIFRLPHDTSIIEPFEAPVFAAEYPTKVKAFYMNEDHTEQGVDVQTGFLQVSGCRYMSFNFNKQGPQHDYCFRRAWRIIADRQKMIRELKGDRESPADSFFREVSKTSSFRGHGLGEARLWLNKSIYAGERVVLYCFDQKGSREDAEWLCERARSIGMQLDIHPFAMTDFFNKDIDDRADLLLCGEVFEEDMELGFVSMLKDKTVFIRRFLNNRQRRVLDELAKRFMYCKDVAREKMIAKTEDFLRKDLLILFNYHASEAWTYSEALSGIEMNAYGWADFGKLWIKPART